MADHSQIRFRPLGFEDLELMRGWLNTDFVARLWPGWPTPEQVREKYTPRITGQEPSRGFIIELADRPIGFVQAYRIREWPDYHKFVDEAEDAAGIDLFIGEPGYAHRGLGPAILRAFLRDVVFATLDVPSCIIGPAVNNRAAIRAYEKAGFKYLKTISAPDEPEPEYLMRIGRDEITE